LVDFDGSLPLVALFKKEKVEFQLQIKIAKVLFEGGADVNQQEPTSGQTVLHAAAAYTDEQKVIEFLMNRSPHINLLDAEGRTPLHHAVCCKHKRWVKTLLGKGASVRGSDLGDTPPLERMRHESPFC
jgi:ankyrin repeat protein